jgi:mannose-6-phosphate isomerase-like protein (cupin superfamily)
MDVVNLYRHLEHVQIDEKTGIRIDRITGNEQMSLYAAEIAPHTRLRPHYHNHGEELYQILEGSGTMSVGNVSGSSFVFTETFPVTKGDCFTIAEGMVHQLANPSDQPLFGVFICSPSHLGNDRYFVE